MKLPVIHLSATQETERRLSCSSCCGLEITCSHKPSIEKIQNVRLQEAKKSLNEINSASCIYLTLQVIELSFVLECGQDKDAIKYKGRKIKSTFLENKACHYKWQHDSMLPFMMACLFPESMNAFCAHPVTALSANTQGVKGERTKQKKTHLVL